MIKDRFVKLKKGGGLFVALALLLIMVLPVAAYTAGTVVSISDASAQNCNTVTVPISITDVTDLAAADIWLNYDSTVVEVTAVTAGDLGPLTSYTIDNPAGVTKMNWFSVTPMSGDLVFAYVTLHAVGTAGQTSPLDLDVKDLTDSSLDPIPHTIVDGTFTVAGAPTEPDISVDPTSKDFGNVDVGSSSAAQTFTVSNEGTADLEVGTITLSGANADQFSIQNDNCSGQTIALTGSATLQVVFSPTSTGTKTAQLSIPSNDPDEDPLTVSLQGRGTAAGVTIQVAFLMDASGSIGGSNWNIMVNGLADAVENSLCIPQDSSVELTVVRFANSASTVVGPVVITSANAASVASDIRAISFTSGGTCISCAFDEAATALQNSVYFSASVKQAINLVTDGNPNSASASETARDNCITTLQMTESQDVICAEAIGSGPNIDWLQDEIVFPQPGCEWDGTSPTCSGWVRQVTDAEGFADTICEKLAAIIAEPPVCDFTAAPRKGMAALRVQFTDLSTGDIESWAWDLDNDGVIDSMLQNPSYTYTAAGIYTVSLTATGPGGSCTETKVAYITVQALPTEEVPEPANLKAAYLLVSPEQVQPNQEVEISINIGNDGGTAGTRSIALYINGHLEDSQTVSVSPGSAKNVAFRVTRTEPGTYQVLLEGNEGQFTVTGTADARHWAGPLGTGGIIAIVVFVIALVLGLVFVLRRE